MPKAEVGLHPCHKWVLLKRVFAFFMISFFRLRQRPEWCLPLTPALYRFTLNRSSIRVQTSGATARLPVIALLAMRAAMLTVSPQFRTGSALGRQCRRTTGRHEPNPHRPSNATSIVSWPICGDHKVQLIPADRPFPEQPRSAMKASPIVFIFPGPWARPPVRTR